MLAEYSKDLPTYLQHCKDVVFAGLESLFEDHEEEKMIEQFWNYYQNQKVMTIIEAPLSFLLRNEFDFVDDCDSCETYDEFLFILLFTRMGF